MALRNEDYKWSFLHLEVAQNRSAFRMVDFACTSATMRSKKDQRIQIKFLVDEGRSQTEVIRRVQAVNGNGALCRSAIQKWYNRFQSGDPSVDDKPKSGAPRKRTAAKIQQVRDLVNRDKRSTLRELSRDSGLSFGCVRKVVKDDLGLKKKPAKWIPHLLTAAQKLRRVNRCRQSLAILRRRNNRPEAIICEDESWIHAWNPESKEASKQWIGPGEDRPTKVVIERSTLKTMLVAFFDRSGMIYHEFVLDGHGIGTDCYLEILQRFKGALRRKRPELFRNHRWVLLHDGAPAHIARPVQHFLQENNMEQLPHPGYSPDITPADYWLFNRIKTPLSGHRHRSIADLQTAANAVIASIPAAEFAAAFDRLQPRMRECIQARGNYFERR